MTRAEFFAALKSLGMPVANREFKSTEENPAPPPPFITYQMGSDSDFKADNRHYYNIDNGTIELYTDMEDEVKEKLIEDKLEEIGLSYGRKSKECIPSEAMFQVIWEFQLPE